MATAALPDLIGALKSKDQAILQATGFALAKLGPQAKPALAALKDAQKNLGGASFAGDALTAALKAIGGDGVKELADVIKDPKGNLNQRLRALSELSRTRDPDEMVLAVFQAALQDRDARIRAGTVDAIARFGPKAKATIPRLLELIDDEELAGSSNQRGTDDPVIDALASMGSEAVPGLAAILKDDKKAPKTRFRAAKGLTRMGRKARTVLPTLEEAMEDRILPIATESACAYVLAGGDATKALPVVRQGLKHKSEFVVWNSASAVERMGARAKRMVPDLLPLLKHEDREIRIVAALALSKMGSAARPAVPALAELLKDKDGRLRYQISHALEHMGPDAKDALPVLIERLQDLERSFPNPILVTIGNLGPEAKPALPALLKLLESGDEIHQDGVVNVLGRIGPDAKAAVPLLLVQLEKSSEYNRARAARALGGIGPEARAAIPALKKHLDDEKKMVRVWAAFALARITGESKPNVALLIDLWNEDRPDGSFSRGLVRYDIAQALELLGADAGPALDILLEAMLDEKTQPGTHAHVARALGHLNKDAAVVVPKLIELLERKAERYVRERNCEHACEALGLLGGKAKGAIPQLRRLMDDEENSIVDAAAKALERIESK